MLLLRETLSLSRTMVSADEVVLVSSSQWCSTGAESGYHEIDSREAFGMLENLDRHRWLEVRQFVAEARLGRLALDRSDDQAVLNLIRDALRDGRVIAVQKGEAKAEAPSATVELRRLVAQVEEATHGKLSYRGRQYKLAVDVDLARIPGRDNYEVAPQSEARAALVGIAQESPASAEPVRKASEKLSKDWRPPFSQPEGLVLLRRIPVLATKPKDEGPVLTPSQMRRLVERQTELGIFEVHVIDEVGDKVSGLEMTFTIEDNEISRKTGGDGIARVDTEPGTFATVALADVQAARDLLKARWDKARGKPLIEPKEDVVVYRLGGEAPKFELESKKPRTLSIEPYVIRGRLFGGFFDTSKSFVLPSGLDGVRGLVKLQGKHPDTLLLVVGHTDTAGKPSYNDPLSLERAAAMAAYLKGTVDDWYAWYDKGVVA